MNATNKIKFLAYYLPQYHQIPENDEWWGEGFTEWTNVKKAKPLFKGHEQPVVPGELGYYDLLKTEGIQEKQAALAKEYGIDGFIYYQYWFGDGKMLLEKPAEKMLANKKVDIPFCFCWANQTWSGIWHGAPKKVLIEQIYPGEEDEQNHFDYLLPFFKDERYIKIDGKPLFVIYDFRIPDIKNFICRLRKRAQSSGLKGLYIMASNIIDDEFDLEDMGFDGKISKSFNNEFKKIGAVIDNKFLNKVKYKISTSLGREFVPFYKYDFKTFYKNVSYRKLSIDTFPMVLPNWDNTPRSGKKGVVLTNSSPKAFEKEVSKAVKFLKESNQKNNFVIVKSWNEWAEGNFIEPDLFHKTSFLEVIKKIKYS